MSGPAALAGVRVLDLSTGIAGPVAAMLLGDLGAEVVRVESPPKADPLPGEPMWHRNKTVLRSAPDRPEVCGLAAGADVVVTSSSRVATAAGLDDPAPRRVHLALPVLPDGLGVGPDAGEDVDPLTANALLAALSGVARRQSSYAGGPVESVLPHLAYLHGLWGATTAVAALVERASSGCGQRVTVDGLHAVLVAATTTIVVDPQGVPPTTSVGPGGPNPAYSTYRCADGQWLFLGGLTDKFQRTAFGLLGVAGIFADPRIADQGERLYAPDNREWVRAEVAAAFATRPRQEWLDALAAADCPAGPVEPPGAWLDHPQVRALGQRWELHDPLVGTVAMPGHPVVLTGTPVPPARPRALAADAADVAWSPRPDPGVRVGDGTRRAGRGPLSGNRVLDLGTVLAGPYAGMLLAELGAEVVKVEPPTGDAFRLRGHPHNRGQRSLAVDLRAPEGYAALLGLVERADIVIDNFRPGVLERLRLRHDDLAAARPDIVTVSITGYGDVGPLAGRPGFDPVLQAMSGMMAAQGGSSAPVFSTLAVNDVTAACASALGAVAALHHVVTGGAGQHVETTLAAVATFMQCGEIVEYADRPPTPVGGPDHPGPSALSSYYRTADGFVRLHVASHEQLRAAGLDPVERVSELSSDEVVERVRSAGGHAVRARSYVELAADPWLVQQEYLVPITWPDGRTTYLPNRYARFDRTQESRVLVAPGLGEHTDAVLTEAGIEEDAIAGLVADGVLTRGGPLTSVADVGYR
ncbi:hypothetical protein GCM10023350_30600 [Nocardioides endophyticus]|uniref:CoA transferase n=1 Tax=Nocardioides endophyticus TaxID=1353775 RepID=A0ABP8Z1H0_9ACTN